MTGAPHDSGSPAEPKAAEARTVVTEPPPERTRNDEPPTPPTQPSEPAESSTPQAPRAASERAAAEPSAETASRASEGPPATNAPETPPDAASAPAPVDPSQRDTPFFEDDLPPEFWDGSVGFDDLEPGGADEAAARSAPPPPAAPAPQPDAAPPVRPAPDHPLPMGDVAASDPHPTGEGERDPTERNDDDAKAAGAETFAALRQLFPGRILGVEPIDDGATPDDGYATRDDTPDFEGADDADAVGTGVD